MKGIKTLCLAIMLFGLVAVATATDELIVKRIEINGYEVCEGDLNSGDMCQDTIDLYELSDELKVDVKVWNQEDNDTIEDVSMVAFLSGYEYSDRESVMDSVHVFDLKGDRSVWKHMIINIPQKLERDEYDLRILVSTRTGQSNEYRVRIEVEGARHDLAIKGVVFSPEKVISGRSLLTYIRLKNYGELDEETVKVKVEIPELDVSASEYVDDLESDDSISTEELYLRIPKCSESGIYDVIVSAEYDEGYERVSEEYTIEIVADESEICEDIAPTPAQTIVTVGSEMQDVAGGKSVKYPITLTNMGHTVKSYSVIVDGANFATFTVTPTNVVVLNPGESKAVYVDVVANEGVSPGEYMFAISVKSGDELLKQIALKANVVEDSGDTGTWTKIKKALEVGLVVLVVLLVILGLIIGFNKMKGSEEDEEEDEGKTYY